MTESPGLPFVEGFDETSFLLAGTLFLLAFLTVQVLWAYRNRSGSEPAAQPSEAHDADDDMIICPECSEPTEAEYRYCRHCAEDTGKSYVGSRGDDGSSSSGML